MKFAFMTFSCPNLTLDEVLALARQHGYDGIEFRIDAKHRHEVEPEIDAARRAAVREQAAAAGIKLACIATSCRFADPATSAGHVTRARQSIDLAADIGAPCIRIFGGKLGEGLTRADAVQYVAQTLSPLAEYAAQRQVTLCMETHDDWCDPGDVAAVIQAVNSPGLAANWDIMHPVRARGVSIDKSFETLRPWIRHVHVHDGITRDGKLILVPIGQGDIDHRRALELLQNDGYTGFISGEWIAWSEPYATHLPQELATMKQYLVAG